MTVVRAEPLIFATATKTGIDACECDHETPSSLGRTESGKAYMQRSKIVGTCHHGLRARTRPFASRSAGTAPLPTRNALDVKWHDHCQAMRHHPGETNAPADASCPDLFQFNERGPLFAQDSDSACVGFAHCLAALRAHFITTGSVSASATFSSPRRRRC
jgi:hypothetical protein